MASRTSATSSDAPSSLRQSSKPRVKKKVRMQELLLDDDFSKPIDTFRVQISNVRANLRVAEPRPVLLSFSFDDVWSCETDVFRQNSVHPRWSFNADSVKGVQPTHVKEDFSLKEIQQRETRPFDVFAAQKGLVPTINFHYETEFGYKLHRKFLTIVLSERSAYNDVEWGRAVIPLDSIARGCPTCDFTIIASDGVTCYGNVYCNIRMTNVQALRVHLTDLKLSDYPEAYNYDVKLIYLELGHNGFTKGYRNCTEKRSETQPRFSTQPALQWHTTLQDMLRSGTSDSPALKIFFSVHRQVARNRTEEIGVGALPIRMLFTKINDGWMDLPTKFKVPLANYKGVIKGKVLLRNIPQFSQLPGSDLMNVDGVITPQNVDLHCRKIVPWMKLPKSSQPQHPGLEHQSTSMPNRSKHSKFEGTVAKGLENHSRETSSSERQDVAMRKVRMNFASNQNVHSPITETTSEEGSEHSRATSPAQQTRQTSAIRSLERRRSRESDQRLISSISSQREKSLYSNRDSGILYSSRNSSYLYSNRETSTITAPRESSTLYAHGGGADLRSEREWSNLHDYYGGREDVYNGQSSATTPSSEVVTFPQTTVRYSDDPGTVSTHTEFGNQISTNEQTQQQTTMVSELCRQFESTNALTPLEQIRKIGAMRTAAVAEEQNTTHRLQSPAVHIMEQARPSANRRQRSDISGSSHQRASDFSEDGMERESDYRSRLSKSAKSGGSLATTDGGVEIGSMVYSDDGYAASRTTTEDALVVSQRFSTVASSEDNVGRVLTDGGYSGGFDSRSTSHAKLDEEEEWEAYHDASSLRYYFVSRITQESLWLPPDWERMEDEYGKQFFVDHGSRNTQRGFPATEAREYRESVYAG